MSRETVVWTVVLVLAAEQQLADVYEVPVILTRAHDYVSSRSRLSDPVLGMREVWRLARRTDGYGRRP